MFPVLSWKPHYRGEGIGIATAILRPESSKGEISVKPQPFAPVCNFNFLKPYF